MGEPTSPPNWVLPWGLPASMASGKDGFTRLCTALGIETRNDRQRLAKYIGATGTPKKLHITPPRDLRTADRLQWLITNFYGIPEARRDLWRTHFSSRDYPESGLPPSLERRALADYDSVLFDAPIDEDALADCRELYNPGIVSVEWRRPGMAALPRIRRDLLRWDSLGSERQECVALAAFATATILDDVRLLLWATRNVDTLVDTFAFVHSDASDQGGNDKHDTRHPGNEPATAPVRGRGDDVAEVLRVACSSLAKVALQLGDNPTDLALFEEVAGCADEVAQLREPVTAVFETAHLADIVDQVAERIRLHTSDVPGLAAHVDNFHALWKLAYLLDGDVTTEQLQADAERVATELTNAVDTWCEVVSNTESLADELSKTEAIGRENPFDLKISKEVEKLHRAVAESKSREGAAITNLFETASPMGHEYDPYRNYQRDWTDTDPEAVPQLPGHHEDQGGIGAVGHEHVTTDLAQAHLPIDSPTKGESPSDTSSNTHELIAVSTATTVSEAPLADEFPSDVEEDIAEKQQDRVENPDEFHGHRDSAPVEIADATDDVSDARTTAVWRAIGDRRLGIAYHIARLCHVERIGDSAFPPAEIIAAAALGDTVCGPDGDVVNALRDCLEIAGQLDLTQNDPELQDALNLLLLSSTLRAALFAPTTGALPVLRRIGLSNGLSPLYEFIRSVADHAERLQSIPLDVLRLQTALNGTAWKIQFEKHAADVRDWHRKAISQRVLFRPAHQVWMHWLQKGILNELVTLLSDHNEASKARVVELLRLLDDRQEFKNLVRDTDRTHLRRRTGNDIQARALTQLTNHATPLRTFAHHWLRLMAEKSDDTRFVEQVIAALRGAVTRLYDDALKAIDQVAETRPTMPLAATLNLARASLQAFATLLNSDEDSTIPSREHRSEPSGIILSRDILYVTEIELDTRYRLVAEQDPSHCLELLLDTAAHATDLGAAFDARLQGGDLIGAHLVCERMAVTTHEDEDRWPRGRRESHRNKASGVGQRTGKSGRRDRRSLLPRATLSRREREPCRRISAPPPFRWKSTQ